MSTTEVKKKAPRKKTTKAAASVKTAAPSNDPAPTEATNAIVPESSSKTEATVKNYIDNADAFKKKQTTIMDSIKSFVENQNYYYSIDQIFEPAPVPVIGMISPKGGSGKSSFALTFSALLSSLGIKVLLVDYDFITHGLSLLLTNSKKFELYNRDKIITVEDIIEKIVEKKGKVDKYIISNKEHFFNRIENSPQDIPLAHNLYAVLGKLASKEEVLKNPQFAALPLLLNDCIFEFIIKNFTLSRQNFHCIVLDVSAGLFSETILKHISHPIFLSEVGLDSIRGIERLHSIWRETAKEHQDVKFSSKIGKSLPYLLYNKVCSMDEIHYAMNLHKYETKNHFYLLPPLPFVSRLKQNTNKRDFVDKLFQMTPYILQIYETINVIFPSFKTETVLHKRYEKARNDFELIPVRSKDSSQVNHNFMEEYEIVNAIQEHYELLKATGSIVGPKITDYPNRSHKEDYQHHHKIDEEIALNEIQIKPAGQAPQSIQDVAVNHPIDNGQANMYSIDLNAEVDKISDKLSLDENDNVITLSQSEIESDNLNALSSNTVKRGYRK